MRITEDMLRKKAEHNEGMLSTLEELALHQLDIEKIENFDKFCRHIQILLLQNNLIERFENLNKLKELKYINLALNNISLIENIEHCESLEKIDLTCNFIEAKSLLESAFNLKKCPAIRELYLTGNPCTDFKPYREIVAAVVDQLVLLDGKEILPSERIIAKQNFDANVRDLESFVQELEKKLQEMAPEERENLYNKEYRKRVHLETSQNKTKDEEADQKPKPTKKVLNKYLPSGDLRQCNEGGYLFTLSEYDDPKYTTFILRLPKFMDSSFISTEILPNCISVIVKDKLTQIRLWEEILITPVELKRSTTTGELYIKLQKVKYDDVIARQQKSARPSQKENQKMSDKVHIGSDDEIPDLE
jgi:protein TilB